jgi:uridylate kinase
MTDSLAPYRRVLLKLSGEALMGGLDYGIEPKVIQRLAAEIATAQSSGMEIAIVIGGGNIFRGAGLARAGMDRVTGDYMGMLATVMNALALQSMLEALEVPTRVQSAIEMKNVAEPFIRRVAIRHLELGRVVIFAAGTGNPFFSTDTTAALRASEIAADVVMKATKVDGVYDKDPVCNPDAVRFEHLSFTEAIELRLNVMDTTAFTLCRDNEKPIVVFDMMAKDNLRRALVGEPVGTLVSSRESGQAASA